MLQPRRMENFLGRLEGPENQHTGEGSQGRRRSAPLNPWHAEPPGLSPAPGRDGGARRCAPAAEHAAECTDVSLVFYLSVTGINLHLFSYCFISFYDNVRHNII